MQPLRFLAALLTTWLLGTVGSPAIAQGQTLEGRVLTDHDYAFRLTAPLGWNIHLEEAARNLNSDSIMALDAPRFGKGGIQALVVVEPTPEGYRLEAIADMVEAALIYDELACERRTDTEFGGFPATEMVHTGSFGGVRVRTQMLVIVRGNFTYQLFVAGMEVNRSLEGGFSRVRDAFEFLEGPPRIRVRDLGVPDQRGLDWEVQGGVYTNVSLPVRVVAPEGFRLIVGEDLEAMDPGALVGFERGDGGIYGTLNAERVLGRPSKGWVAEQAQSIWSNLEIERSYRTTRTVRGEKRFLSVGSGAEGGIRYGAEVRLERETLHTWLAWGLVDELELPDAMTPILEACRAPTRLELEEVRARLDAVPESPADAFDPTLVGLRFAYRDGIFRHFAEGLEMVVPGDIAWAVDAGAGVEEEWGEFALAYLEARSLGIYVKVEVQPLGRDAPVDLDLLHADGLELETSGYFRGETTGPRPVEIAGRSALTETAQGFVGWSSITTRLWTVLDAEGWRLLRVTAWGYSECVDAGADAVDTLIAGISWSDDPLAMSEQGEGRYVNHRMGFTLDTRRRPFGRVGPGLEGPFTEDTPEHMASIATTVEVPVAPGKMFVSAIHMVTSAPEDKDVFERICAATMGEHSNPWAEDESPELDSVLVAGQPGFRHRTGDPRSGMDLVFTRRGRTAYLLVLGGHVGERARMASWLVLD